MSENVTPVGDCHFCGEEIYPTSELDTFGETKNTHIHPALQAAMGEKTIHMDTFNAHKYLSAQEEGHPPLTTEEFEHKRNLSAQRNSPNHPSLQKATVNNVVSMEQFRESRKKD